MKPKLEIAKEAILNAQRAGQRGDRQSLRRYAEQAVALCPELEEPWLLMAAVGSPKASVAYLEQALRINPQSERARMGMHWAAERLREATSKSGASSPQDEKSGEADSSLLKSLTEPETQPQVGQHHPTTVASSAPEPSHKPAKSLAKYKGSFLTLLVLAVCATAAWVFWPGNASPALAFLRPQEPVPGIFGAPVELDKPTYTPTFTPTFTPTNTFTPTSTFTATPTQTATFTPTETFTPSLTPQPTNTYIPWPTSTPRPRPTNTPITYTDTSGRWIDVDLSQQMLYAYEGNTIVASFLVSTGVPAYPTVTGQFHIYIKLESTLMAGYGYYLPNVPYTMYFYYGYGLHGTYWHNNFGHPMSHGCVNMYTPDAQWLFYWASVGTLVNIHY